MPTLQELEAALVKADAAGNADDARALAAAVRQARASAAPKAPESDMSRLITGNAKPRTMGQEVGRQIGLTARYMLSGPLEFAGIFTDPIAQKLGLGSAREGAQQLGDTLGLPNPQGAGERIVADASKAMTGGGPSIGAGRMLSRAPGMVGMVGEQLAYRPGLQVLSAGTAGGSASAARESGAGAGGQLAAGLIGGLLPSAAVSGVPAGLRGVVRGNNAEAVQDTVNTFKRAGTMPSAGQAAGNRRAQGLESLLAGTPGGSGPMARAAEGQAAQIGAKVDSVVSALSPRASAEQAGRGIERGVETFMDQFRQTSAGLYAKVDSMVPPQMPVAASNTQAYLASAASSVPGAKNVSALLSNPKMAGIRDALEADLAAGPLPYEALKQLRSKVGEMIGDAGLLTDIPTKQLRKLYGALSADMEGAIRQTGNPQAMAAFKRANDHFKAGFGDGGRVDTLSRVIERNGGPEKVFAAAVSGTKEGATTLRAVTQSLPPDGRKMLAAAVVKRLGRATAGKQDESGEVFSTETFLTNWNTMAPEAKSALFARLGPKFNADMDAIAKTAAKIRAGSKVFANPSGSGPKVAQMSAGAAFVYSVASGNWPAAAAIAGGAGSANVLANAMTNPKFVELLARQTKMPTASAAQVVAAIRAAGEPELAEQWAKHENPSQRGY